MILQKRISAVSCLGWLALAVLFLRAPTLCAAAFGAALSACAASLLPALFPFFVVSSLLLQSPGAPVLAFGLRPLCRALGLKSRQAPLLLLLGWLGGYTALAAALAEARRRGEISRSEGELLLAAGVVSSPGFAVGAVGGGMLGSPRTGLALYLAALAANLLCAAGMRLLQLWREGARREGMRCEGAQRESAQYESTWRENTQRENARYESAQQESTRQERARQESARRESEKAGETTLKTAKEKSPVAPGGGGLSAAIGSAVQSSLSVCGCVIFFRMLLEVLLPLLPWRAPLFRAGSAAALEACTGCSLLAALGGGRAVLGCCAAQSLLSLSVWSQLKLLLGGRCRLAPLIVTRPAHLALSLLFTRLFLRVLPGTAAVYSTLAPRVVVLRRIAPDRALLLFGVLCCVLELLHRISPLQQKKEPL